MSENSDQQSRGQLMESLVGERGRFASDEDFRAFVLDSVRRFITDLRALDIEISLRPNHYDKAAAPTNSSGRLYI
jgi:hypothetical protein